MADCRSLIEFLRAFEHHRRRATPSSSSSDSPCAARPRRGSSSSQRGRRLFTSLCDHSPMAAIDAVALLAVVSALAFLVTPYVRMVAAEVGELVSDPAGVSYVPFAAGAGAAIAAVAGVVAWDAVGHRARRCGKPRCRGLRKAVEFDIQLETEECVRGQQQLLPLPGGRAALLEAAGARPVQLGDAHRELEAELRKMAPPNGRTVLIFRSPCGCPKGRMEVWGAKKLVNSS
ncbi:hypothetical protein E2562_016649 [Oryza meyeriana var. granulata]|uniref:Ribosomal protein L34e superfamily protein n=1 Tax=Oryza meyeriana var. granulata TaxID=110450 RepID=A0A6G1EL63_9ORYZ|nr:hypothetical protein E2562_016649 [Oryza meyeriana var. granulata]KAF0925419.1 hypothetical protein E2562_016649 [Oryza meyeriana var. granulata]KAF0925420.1 hypothetical protein E2562_016649 [Oryza meyeriana var. granulata]KAF0925421.1 hypothetical protein E2562_016649 [Oryza meyeriana var. granulata]KAF0925422.1 hypothetical protein E2562_016649 [Oryza meyeriana var. granulata]